MTTTIAPQPKTDVTQAGTVAQHAILAPPADYVPLSPELLLLFCQSRLQEMDTAIQKKMTGQNDLVALQDSVGRIQSMLKAGDGQVNGDDRIAFDNPAVVDKVSLEIDAAIAAAKVTGNSTVVKNLEDVKLKLHAGDDGQVNKEEVKDLSTMLDNALSSCRSGAELSMIELQSLVSKRATQLQLTTGLMSSLNEGSKSIAANIGR